MGQGKEKIGWQSARETYVNPNKITFSGAVYTVHNGQVVRYTVGDRSGDGYICYSGSEEIGWRGVDELCSSPDEARKKYNLKQPDHNSEDQNT